jgi:hypothetical protein
MRAAVENLSYSQLEASSGIPIPPACLLEAESLIRNMDPRNLVASLRGAHASIAQFPELPPATTAQIEVALRLQEQWESWLTARELLRDESKRGRDYLEQVRHELHEMRGELEDWPACERICGYNPVAQLLQAIDAKERIERFLPSWLERRDQQLASLTRKMEACARQNGLEHLL